VRAAPTLKRSHLACWLLRGRDLGARMRAGMCKQRPRWSSATKNVGRQLRGSHPGTVVFVQKLYQHIASLKLSVFPGPLAAVLCP